jgi:Fic family protein
MSIWERLAWPNFEWESGALLKPLSSARLKQGRLMGAMMQLGFDLKLEAQLEALTEDVLKTSEIEGELLERTVVRSSLASRLGVPDAGVASPDRRVDGVVAMMLDATTRFDEPLTAQRLFGWHAGLFPTGYSEIHQIAVGAWRTDARGPMQVISGPHGRRRVHFQAPPATALEIEMQTFLRWFNGPSRELEPLVRAGLAHLWFVTIHPFEDGNGRIARAVADNALAFAERTPQRFYSMSSQIQRERKDYYAALERTQKGGLDVTRWLVWFLDCFTRAVDGAERSHSDVLRKADFWRSASAHALNERQRYVLNRFLDGFEGKLTAKKWSALAKCSPATANRDIVELLDLGLLRRNSGGSKNTSYDLNVSVADR